MLAKVDGEYYAVDNTCPHLNGVLSDGTLDGYTVTCPRHGSQFDVRNGENLRWLKGSGLAAGFAKVIKPPRSVQTYRTEVKDGKLFIEIK